MKFIKLNYKRVFTLFMAFLISLTLLPVNVFAVGDIDYGNLPNEKAKYLNSTDVEKPAEFENDPKTKDEADAQIKDPEMPKTYTYMVNYEALRNKNQEILYQPYTATVGDFSYQYKDIFGNDKKVMTDSEKNKIQKTVYLPKMEDYETPVESYFLNYDIIKSKATTLKDKPNNGFFGSQTYLYKPIERKIKIKHIFQDLYDKNSYGYKDGMNENIFTYQDSFVGFDMIALPLADDMIEGYVPEQSQIDVRVPDDVNNFVVEYRYNRRPYTLKYDSDGGTDVPAQTLYYGQTIPNLNENPTKRGSLFKGWKSNCDLEYKDADGNTKTLAKNTVFNMNSFPNGIKEAMPAKDVTLTAVWEGASKANYVIQFWTEKADSEGYDYIGAKIVEGADTGTRPDLSLMKPAGIKFPEIEETLTDDGKEKELSKYYVRNDDKILEENTENVEQEDGTNLKLTKKVKPDGTTSYNIYYKRQRYTMLFEKFCIDEPDAGFPAKEAKMVLPDGTKYDSTKEVNNPYNFVAKFGERMTKWPNDMWLIEEGGIDFEPNQSFIGWQLNSENNENLDQSLYLDTPPYWLTSKDFIDRDFTELDPGVRPATHSISTGDLLPERTISLGPCSSAEYQFAIYYMEYLFEGFDGALHYNPDMSYTKIDTIVSYYYPSPGIVGFTPKHESINPVDDANLRPDKRIGYTEDLSKLSFDELGKQLDKSEANRKNNEKSFFDPIAEKGINGVPFKDIPRYRFAFTYEREKYKLFLDTDSSNVNENSYFLDKKLANGKSATINDVYYDIPLRKLNLDEEYKLTEADRPGNLPTYYEFKGWALDPEGKQLIKDSIDQAEKLEIQIDEKYDELAKNSKDKEKKAAIKTEINNLKAKLDEIDSTMPNYDRILYAKWGEPDYKWKIKFDPNGGEMGDINPSDLATKEDGEPFETSHGNVTYKKPEKNSNEGDTQVFTSNHRMTIKQPSVMLKKDGYDFLGWEVVRYKADNTEDTSYRDKYGVPELYTFGNEVVGNISLRAIWVKNDLMDINVYHHFLDSDYNELKTFEPAPIKVRVGSYANASAIYQGRDNILVPKAEYKKLEDKNSEYKDYKEQTGRENTYFQSLRVEPLQIEKNGTMVDNPDARNYFHFYYRSFKKRHYKINYLSTPEKDSSKFQNVGTPSAELKTQKILPTENIENENKDYDSKNYRRIPGFMLVGTPQIQLFFDLDEKGELIGINGVKSDEINFYYRDVRIIKRKTPSSETPNGYHRVKFVADRGGSFGKDENGKPIKEIYYDVIDGLEFSKIPVPKEQGEVTGDSNPVITPDFNHKFLEWADSELLGDNILIDKDYTFTAKFKTIKDSIEIITGKEKFPEYFIDVYVDTTDKADDSIDGNQYTGDKRRHFKINPYVNVDLPVNKPIGKTDYVRKFTWKFDFWQVVPNGTKYNDKISGIFENNTLIKASYYADMLPMLPPVKTIEKIVIPKGDNITPKDYVTNIYNKDDPTNKDNLPKDTEFEFITPPDTNVVGGHDLIIKVRYPGGEKCEIPVKLVVTEDVIVPNGKDDIPDNYVKVIVDYTDKAKLEDGEKVRKEYWVNPNKKVLIPAKTPNPIDGFSFTEWTTGEEGVNLQNFDMTAVHQFETETVITARYMPKPTLTVKQLFSDGSEKVPEESKKIEYNSKIQNPNGLKDGYKEDNLIFCGWFKDEDFTEKFDFNQNIKNDTTIYGLWNRVPELQAEGMQIKKGEDLDLKTLVKKAYDEEDGDLTDVVVILSDGGFNKDKPGKYTIEFSVTDKLGATTKKTVIVTVVDNKKPAGNNDSQKTGGIKKFFKLPKTGLDNHLFIYVIIAFISSAFLIIALSDRKRKNK